MHSLLDCSRIQLLSVPRFAHSSPLPGLQRNYLELLIAGLKREAPRSCSERRVVLEHFTPGIDDEDRSGYEDWIKDVEPGEVADHPLLPVVYP